MTINTQKLREALSQIEDALNDAYQSAGQECCGHGRGGECCGNPEPVWDAADQKIMDVLGPIQRMLSDAVSQADAQTAKIARLRKALKDLMVASPSQLACEAFHHNPSDRHVDADVCQPVKRYQDALEAASAALAQEQGESK